MKVDDKVIVTRTSCIFPEYKKVGKIGKIVKCDGYYCEVYFDEYPHTAYDAMGHGYNKNGWSLTINELKLLHKVEFKPGDRIIFKSVLLIENNEIYDFYLATELLKNYGYLVVKDVYDSNIHGRVYEIIGLNFGIPVEFFEIYKENKKLKEFVEEYTKWWNNSNNKLLQE